jgi:transposase, IS5 family
MRCAASSNGGVGGVMKLGAFESMAWVGKCKVTRRECNLAEMGAVILMSQLLAPIEAHCPRNRNGPQPKPMKQMLAKRFMLSWFNLPNSQTQDLLYDIESMRRFAGDELDGQEDPGESTILRFRHLVERQQLIERIFIELRSLLEEQWPLLKSGAIVDAAINAAPPSTKNGRGAHDPERRQTEVRYHSLAKYTVRRQTALALANLYVQRRWRLPPQWTCAL